MNPEPVLSASETTPVEMLPSHLLPNIDVFVTEDDTPVDNLFSAKQQRLLVEPLYSSWGGPGEGRVFMADANVGLFYSVYRPPLVPDVFLSLDVEAAQDIWEKKNRSYFLWEFGKPPEVVIEIVSNRKGHEADTKLHDYAQIGIGYYVIFDPEDQLGSGVLRIFEWFGDRRYKPKSDGWLAGVELGLTLWRGVYDGVASEWLRWCDRAGDVIPTGYERAERERARAEYLAERLRAVGVDPNT